MTVRKTTKKPAGKTTKKKAPASKATAKKAAPKPKKAAAKTGASVKASPSKKPAAGKKAAAAGAKSPGAAPGGSGTASKPASKSRGAHSSLNVNMGQIFGLRPRTQTSFRPGDFQTARHVLSDEDYDSPEAAARAVAEKALELTRKGSSKRGFKPGR